MPRFKTFPASCVVRVSVRVKTPLRGSVRVRSRGVRVSASFQLFSRRGNVKQCGKRR